MHTENISRSDANKIILTSENDPAVKEKIDRISKILMERNKKAYKELSNKSKTPRLKAGA